MNVMLRCPWATAEPNITYHDEEWGVPVHNDRLLFEFLILEGAQAGLSWTTILKKRDNYRKGSMDFVRKKSRVTACAIRSGCLTTPASCGTD
jgi:DNA-3-methyladenine glycosylase I